MKYNEIESLLEKYWEGETSLEEERALKAYFNAGTPVDERLRTVAPLFAALRAERAVELPPAARVVSMPSTPRNAARRLWLAAASVAILLTAAYWCLQRPGPSATEAAPIARTQTPTIEAPIATVEAPATPGPVVTETIPPAKIAAAAPRRRPAPRAAKATEATDAEAQQAMEEIKAALALVSSKMRKGQQKATRGLREMEHLDKSLDKIKETQG